MMQKHILSALLQSFHQQQMNIKAMLAYVNYSVVLLTGCMIGG